MIGNNIHANTVEVDPHKYNVHSLLFTLIRCMKILVSRTSSMIYSVNEERRQVAIYTFVTADRKSPVVGGDNDTNCTVKRYCYASLVN